MRLTIAATLLAQAIPAAASSSQSKNNVGVAPLQNKNLKIMSRLQASRKQRLGKDQSIEESILHGDPTIENILLVNKSQVGAPLLKNSKKVECDPSSQELLDVGILSCGAAGQYSCEESKESSLGGFCVIEAEAASSVSRVLQADYSSVLCNPTSELFRAPVFPGVQNCNCDEHDLATKTGPVRCLVVDECCAETDADSFCGSISSTWNFGVGGFLQAYERCHSFTAPYERSTCSNTMYDDVYTCEIKINGEACSSCTIAGDAESGFCSVFDCTNTGVTEAGIGNNCVSSALPLVDFAQGSYEGGLCVAATPAPTFATTPAPVAATDAPAVTPAPVAATDPPAATPAPDGAVSFKAKRVFTVISVFAGLFSFVMA
jgi:hypothetical protein